MPAITQTTIRCSSCGQPFAAEVRTYIDPAQDPQGKIALLNGQLNMARCAQCGVPNTISAPLLYHDATKELLVAYVPMELNLQKDQQEKIIGDLMRALPKDNFKGYMFSPRRALTMQGLIEQVLQADGVTPEMMEKQRERVKLVQQLVDAPDDQISALVTEHDALIDRQFFQTMTMMAQRMLEVGQPQLAQRVAQVQNYVAQLSTVGQALIQQQMRQEQIVQEVAQTIQALGEGASRADFMGLAVQYAGDDDRLQALVGMARPAFDYTFFQELAVFTGQAPAQERERLEVLRDTLLALTENIDAQARMEVNNAARLLQALLEAPDMDEMLQANAHLINDTFMAVLTVNIQEADRAQNGEASTRLRQIYERVVIMMQDNMPPELIFVNELLSAQNENQARAMIAARAQEFGESLLDMMDAVSEALSSQGNQPLYDRLLMLREEVANTIG